MGTNDPKTMVTMSEHYLAGLVDDVLKDVAADFSSQRNALIESGIACDWYFWNAKKVPIRKWAGRILHPKSTWHHEEMRTPRPSPLYFNPAVGLVPLLMSKKPISSGGWMRQRLEESLEHLYGLRCAVVHQGRRLATGRWASHLGRIGLETLAAVVRDDAAEMVAWLDENG